MASISVEEFRKAVTSLVEAQSAYIQQKDISLKDILRDAVIQRFEFSVELAWKTAIKKLGLIATAPKPAVREMARAGLIENVDRWFDYIEARNKSSHTYDKKIAEEVMIVIPEFIVAAQDLIGRL